MKLKYYLRGMGIGIILTAIVMGFALGGRKATLSDAEIIQRAKVLGMVEGDNGVLTQTAEEVDGSDEKEEKDKSDKSVGEGGTPVFEEVKQEEPGTDTTGKEVAEGEGKADKDAQTSAQTASSVSQTATGNETSESSNGNDSSSASKTSVEEAAKETTVNNEASVKEAQAEASTEAASTKTEEAATGASSAEEATATAAATTAASTAPAVPSKTVTIPGGMGSDQVAAILAREGIVDNAATFNKYLVERGLDRIIRSGVKSIPEGASYEQVAGIITKG